MVARTIFLILAGCALASVASAQTAVAPSSTPDPHAAVNQRLENQHDRIQAGVKDDQLTKGEATHLKADGAAIHAEEHVYRQSNGGTLTPAERHQLNRQLNRNSRQIYRARHNNRTPK